jgi:hypothetical protein
MSTKLVLRNRKSPDIQVPVGVLKSVITQGKDALWNFFAPLEPEATVHDRQWLTMFVNWSPPGADGQQGKGLELTEIARWFKIAKKVGTLTDGSTEIVFTLSETDLLWERMQDKRFMLRNLPSAFAEFMLDFLDVTGRHFATVKDDPEEPPQTKAL